MAKEKENKKPNPSEEATKAAAREAERLAAEARELAAKVDALALLYGVPVVRNTQATLARLCELHGLPTPDETYESTKRVICRLRELAGV